MKTAFPVLDDGKLWTRELGPSLFRGITIRDMTTAWLYFDPLPMQELNGNYSLISSSPFAIAPVGNPCGDDLADPNKWFWYCTVAAAGYSQGATDPLEVTLTKTGDTYDFQITRATAGIETKWFVPDRDVFGDHNTFDGVTYTKYLWVRLSGGTEWYPIRLRATVRTSKQLAQKRVLTGTYLQNQDYGLYEGVTPPFTKVYIDQIVLDDDAPEIMGDQGGPGEIVHLIYTHSGVRYVQTVRARYMGHFSGTPSLSYPYWIFSYAYSSRELTLDGLSFGSVGIPYPNILEGAINSPIVDGDAVTVVFPIPNESDPNNSANFHMRIRQTDSIPSPNAFPYNTLDQHLVVGLNIEEYAGNETQGWHKVSIGSNYKCAYNPTTKQWHIDSFDYGFTTPISAFDVDGEPWGFVKTGIAKAMYYSALVPTLPVTVDIILTMNRFLQDAPFYLNDDAGSAIPGDLWNLCGKGKIKLVNWLPAGTGATLTLYPLDDMSGSTTDRPILTNAYPETDGNDYILHSIMPGRYKIKATGEMTDGDWIRDSGQANDFDHAKEITVTRGNETSVSGYEALARTFKVLAISTVSHANKQGVTVTARYNDGGWVDLATGTTNENGWAILSFSYHSGVELHFADGAASADYVLGTMAKAYVPELNEYAYRIEWAR